MEEAKRFSSSNVVVAQNETRLEIEAGPGLSGQDQASTSNQANTNNQNQDALEEGTEEAGAMAAPSDGGVAAPSDSEAGPSEASKPAPTVAPSAGTITSHRIHYKDQDEPTLPGKYMRMNTAVQLNEIMRRHSGDASLIILNFPAPPKDLSDEEDYMFYLEALTEQLNKVLLVRGSGREVVTIYS